MMISNCTPADGIGGAAGTVDAMKSLLDKASTGQSRLPCSVGRRILVVDEPVRLVRVPGPTIDVGREDAVGLARIGTGAPPKLRSPLL